MRHVPPGRQPTPGDAHALVRTHRYEQQQDDKEDLDDQAKYSYDDGGVRWLIHLKPPF